MDGGEHLERVRNGAARAVAMALGLGLIAVLPVAWSLLLSPPATGLRNEGLVQDPVDWLPMSPGAAVALAAGSVLPASLVGGVLGALAWRWRRFAGAAVALATGWATGVVILPMVAAVLGIHLRTGIVCIMACEALLRDDRPLGGFVAYAEFLLATVFIGQGTVLTPLLIGLVAYVLWAWIRGRPAARPRLPLLGAVAVFAILHGSALVWVASVLLATVVPYVSLAVGVVIWTAWMDRADRRSGRYPKVAPPAEIPATPPAIPGSVARSPGAGPDWSPPRSR